MSTTSIETRQAINRLMEGQINQRMLANVTQEYVFRVVDKAMASDSEDVVRSKKLLLLSMGLAPRLISGLFAVLIGGAFLI